jgi:hypothetical protein
LEVSLSFFGKLQRSSDRNVDNVVTPWNTNIWVCLTIPDKMVALYQYLTYISWEQMRESYGVVLVIGCRESSDIDIPIQPVHTRSESLLVHRVESSILWIRIC